MNKNREVAVLPDATTLVEDNINFVYYLLKEFDIPEGEFEEFARSGQYGLLKAAMNFNPTKGVKFSKYAENCIRNAITDEFRRRKIYRREKSLEEEIFVREDSTSVFRKDVLVDYRTSNYEETLIARQMISETLSIILNVFPTQKKVIMLLSMASWTQKEISEIFQVSQSYTSRLIRRYSASFNKDIEEGYRQRKKEREIFKVRMEEATIKITFPTDKVVGFKRILANVFYQIDDSMAITDFKIIFSKEQITIGMPAEAEYLAFLALLMKEIEDCKETTKKSQKSVI